MSFTWSQFFGDKSAQTADKSINNQICVEMKFAIRQAIYNENLKECRDLLLSYSRYGNSAYRYIYQVLEQFGCDTKILHGHPDAAYNHWIWNKLIADIPEDGFADYAKHFKRQIDSSRPLV